ncbi:ABC transporter substrate-binding protein [Paenibacillus sinopodophylli]|uniref:ABC transporter substrate-binding protein n=1 Tax=Paenibacillus sinopodophylli TaxID=1837342 RepID=UPI00110CE740|nr:extracellular solute-binding protein [Paenibacillus sinopodophylli]
MRKKHFGKTFVASILAMFMVVVTACGGGNNTSSTNNASAPSASPSASEESPSVPLEKIKIKGIGHASWFKAGMDEVLIAAAEKTGIELEIEKIPEGMDGVNLVKARFATGDKPDLLFYYAGLGDTQGFGKMSETFVSQEDQPWIANFDKESWKGIMTAYEDGLYYGAPYGGTNTSVVLYNKKVFESLGLQVPTTMDEFWSVSEALKKGGKIPLYLSGKDAWTLQLPVQHAQASPSTAEVLAKIDVNEAKFADWTARKTGLQFLKDVTSKGLTNKDVLSDTYDNAQKALATGEAGMYIMATWVMTDIASKFPDQTADIGAFLMPYQGAEADKSYIFAPNAVFVVKGENEEAAQKFVNFFESLEAQNIFFSKDGGIPAIKGVTETSLTPAELEAKALLDAGKASGDGFSMKYDINAAFPAYLQDIIIGGKTPEQVLEAQQKDYEKAAKAKDDPNFK